MRPLPDFPVSCASRPSAPGGDLTATGRELLRRFHALPEERLAILRRAGGVALACGRDLFWVGGGVRDLWLGTSELDIDLVVDGALEPFAERLAAMLGAQLRSHPQFLTAEFLAPGGMRVDLAAVRSERYVAPASLPLVSPGTFASDLARRDFTINCLAVPLAPAFGDRLVDNCGGIRDLERRCLRTLHPASFRDDPTRILRGLEFEARLGFSFAPETEREAESAIAEGMLLRLSPARLGEAMRRALGRAESAAGVLRRLRGLNALSAIEPGLARAGDAAARFDAAQGAFRRAAGRPLAGTFRLALLSLALDLDDEPRERLAKRFALPAAERALVVGGPEHIRAAWLALGGEPLASAVHASLALLSDEELAVVAARGEGARAWVERECAELRRFRLRIDGRDLIAAGLPAGPTLGRALAVTLEARLDGRIDAGDELAFALGAAAGEAE